MNTDQILSLVRTLAKFGGGFLVAHGMTKTGAAVNTEDSIGLVMTIIAFVCSHITHKDDPAPTTPPVVKTFLMILTVMIFGLLSFMLVGCNHATLTPGGAYAPVDTNGVATAEADYDLYVVDSAFSLTHDAVGLVFKFERDNRATLWKISPTIKHSLDQIRIQVKTIDLNYAVARNAYMSAPTPPGLGTLQSILAKAQQLTVTAQSLLAMQGLTNAPPK